MLSDPIGRLASVDRCIHEPARLLIIAYLASLDKADFLFLQQELGLTQGNLSQHLNKLEAAGYIRAEKARVGNRTRTQYQITAAGKRAFRQYRLGLKCFLTETEDL